MRVGRVENNWILNPTFQQLEFSTIDLTVTGSADSIVMVEGGALEISEKDVLEALKVGQKGIKELVGHRAEGHRQGRQAQDGAGPRPSATPR